MQSSPYHTNKIFDGKFNMLNVPKSSVNCSWKLVKDTDTETGSFIYKLVNNDIDTKLMNTKLNLMKEAEENEISTEEPLLDNAKPIQYTGEVIPKQKEVIYEPIEKIMQEPIREYLLENNFQLEFDYSSVRAKSRNYIFSCSGNQGIKTNSKDIQKLLQHSRILDYRKGYLTKIEQAIISIQGDCENNFDNLFALFSFKFLKKVDNRNEIFFYNTNKLEIKNDEGKLFQQFVGDIDSYLPTSETNIFNYIPNVQFFNENDSLCSMNLCAKVVLKIQKVPLHSIDIDTIKYLSSEKN